MKRENLAGVVFLFWTTLSMTSCSAGDGCSAGREELHAPLPTEEMVQQMLGQKVLDHPRVEPYLHTEVAANLPLTVHAVAGLALGAPNLTAGGQPVRVTAASDEARFRFTAIERLEGARERIRFEIPAEGVVGSVELELRDWEWHYGDAELVEQ